MLKYKIPQIVTLTRDYQQIKWGLKVIFLCSRRVPMNSK